MLFGDKDSINKVNSRFSMIADWLLDHRLCVILACVLLCISGAILSYTLYVDMSLDIYFLDGDPAFERYQNFLDEYGNDEYVYILYKHKKDIFDLDVLNKTRLLVSELGNAPFVKKVNSITNVEFIDGTSTGDLKIYDFMDKFPKTKRDAELLKKKLIDKPLYKNYIISEDAKYASLICEIDDKPETDPNYRIKITNGIRSILGKEEYRDFKFWTIGVPILNFDYNTMIKNDATLLSTLTFILISILLVFIFRQARALFSSYGIIVCTILLVIGFMAIADFPITVMFSIVPSLLVAIGVANGVHIIKEYQTFLKSGYDNRKSIIEAVRLIGVPCLFTSITTTVGFASLTISPIRALRDFGWYTAVGVLATFIFSFSIMIVILSFNGRRSEQKLEKMREKKGKEIVNSMLRGIAKININHPVKILFIVIIITGIAIYGLTKLTINTDQLGTLGDKIPIYHDYKHVDSVMGVTSNIEILLDTKMADGIKKRKFMKTLEKIQNYADRTPLVHKTFSIVDIVKDINQSLHRNNKAFYKIPSSDQEMSQYILLYEMCGGEELENIVSADLATARLTLLMESVDSNTLKEFYDKLITYIESVKPAEYSHTVTGGNFLAIEAFKYLAVTFRESIIIALVLISLMMIFVFRSFFIGLISMIPNLFPIVVTLGIMGIFAICLDTDRTTIACIGIGLAVDDTIHFITRYRIEFSRLGDYKKALEAATVGIGRAITLTSIILIIGFGICAISQINTIYYFGLLTTLCISLALIADYFVAPPLILLLKPFGKEFDPADEELK